MCCLKFLVTNSKHWMYLSPSTHVEDKAAVAKGLCAILRLGHIFLRFWKDHICFIATREKNPQGPLLFRCSYRTWILLIMGKLLATGVRKEQYSFIIGLNMQ